MTMFGIKCLAEHFGRNITLTMALFAFFVGLVSVKISKLEIFGLNINELTVTLTFAITIYVLMWGLRYRKNSTDRNVICMKPRKEFFQLIKLSMDISTEVLRKLMDSRILSDAKYGGCLHKFLHDEKHYLYHQWQGSTPCCKCPSLGCTLRKSKKLKEWLFKIFYDGNPQDGTHVQFNRHRISSYCLHSFKPNPGLTVNQLDVTILSFFIEHFVPLSPKEISSLNDVVTVRNSICHARNTNSFQPKELENMWIKVSEASLKLTDSPSRNLLKDQISMIKKVEFDSADIETLKEKVEHEGEMLEEIYKFINQNGVTKNCIKESESRIVSQINARTESLQDDVKALKEGHIGFAYEHVKIGDTLGIITEMLHAIKMKVDVYAEKKSRAEDDTVAERLINAVGRIDNENIDERLVVENITKCSDADDNQYKFKVLSAKQSCILLYLKCSTNVLKSEQSFRSAVKSLLSDIVKAGNINTGLPLTIVVKLKFCSPLTDDEINLIKSIVGQTADATHSSSLRERDRSKVLSPQDEKEIEKKIEVYKISSLESHVLEMAKETGIIILTDESYVPPESDIEIRLWDNSNFYLGLPVKVFKNVIEFKIPWDKCPFNTISHGQLYVSVYDKRMKTQTSIQLVKIMSTGHIKNRMIQTRVALPRKQHHRKQDKKSKNVYGFRERKGSPETESEEIDVLFSEKYNSMSQLTQMSPLSVRSSIESGFNSDREVDNYTLSNEMLDEGSTPIFIRHKAGIVNTTDTPVMPFNDASFEIAYSDMWLCLSCDTFNRSVIDLCENCQMQRM